jgi:hypothetical protein
MDEMQPLKSMDKRASQRFRPQLVSVVIPGTIAIVVLMGLVLFLSHPFADKQASPPVLTCAPTADHPGISISDPDQPSSKSTTSTDYMYVKRGPLASVCGPAEIFPPEGGAGIVFGYAVYNNCKMASIQIGIECSLAYRSSEKYLDQPANPTIEIDGHLYGKCRLDDGNPDFSVPELDGRIHCIPVPPYK